MSTDNTPASHFVGKRTVLFGECDPAQVLYTPRNCEYIVEGALRFLTDSLGEPFERYLFAKNLTLPARNLTVDFLRPVTWDDEVELRAELAQASKHALTIRVTASDLSGQLCFSGKVTQVCVNSDTKTIAPIPVDFRDSLRRFDEC